MCANTRRYQRVQSIPGELSHLSKRIKWGKVRFMSIQNDARGKRESNCQVKPIRSSWCSLLFCFKRALPCVPFGFSPKVTTHKSGLSHSSCFYDLTHIWRAPLQFTPFNNERQVAPHFLWQLAQKSVQECVWCFWGHFSKRLCNIVCAISAVSWGADGWCLFFFKLIKR